MKASSDISKYTDLELALMVLQGVYGNGQTRKNALGSRYNAVQSIVQKIVDTGSVPAGNGSGEVDPEKLKDSINEVFIDVLDQIKEEIMNEYDSR